MKRVIEGLEIRIDPDHDLFLVNGRKDISIAKLLTTLKAYLVSILDKNKIKDANRVATKSILDGEIVKEIDEEIIKEFIFIEKPREMKNGDKEDRWKILMTIEGSHQFFFQMMYPEK